MGHFLIILLVISLCISSVIAVDAAEHLPSPYKQLSDGVSPENIVCVDGMLLVLKSSDGSPACVKSASAEKLIQREWATKISSYASDLFHGDAISHDEVVKKANEILEYALKQEQSESDGQRIEGPTDDGYPVVFYDVFGSDIILDDLPQLPSDLLHLQQNVEKHQKIWDVFVRLIPESTRNVSMFYLTTDGEGGIGGGVERDVTDPSMWHLFYDILDAYPAETMDDNEITYTTIHEYGHILTSGTDQIDVDFELVDAFTDGNFDELFQKKSKSCHPNVLMSDGCAKSTSYVNLFYQKFWIDIISEWDEIQYIEDDEEFYEQSDLFYEKYEDRFLTAYSSTNLDEDIAESWTVFVLRDRPMGVGGISDQKILFFYDFPELVDLRDHIRNNL
ncbi:hypothetical protein K0U27_02765 [archaeon]|nr:hypothetical protein [archaeon]